MSASREHVFLLLREKSPIIESLKRLDSTLSRVIDHTNVFLDEILNELGISTEEQERSKEAIAADFRPDLRLNEIEGELAKLQTPEFQLALIKKNKREVFPHIIDFHILELLKERMETEGIEAAEILFDKIKLHGTAMIWEAIAALVTRDTKRLCGTVFPDAAIAEGRVLVLDLKALTVDFTVALFLKKHGDGFKKYVEETRGVTATAASGVASKPPASKAPKAKVEVPYLSGLRVGFLNTQLSATRLDRETSMAKEADSSVSRLSFK